MARWWLGMARGGGEGGGLNRPARLWVTADDGRGASSCYGGSTTERTAGAAEDHVWFEDRWMVASLCDE
jgi:hypothetical protein